MPRGVYGRRTHREEMDWWRVQYLLACIRGGFPLRPEELRQGERILGRLVSEWACEEWLRLKL